MKRLIDLPADFCHISIFEWNNKYILKFESNQLEQTYKINTWDVADIQSLINLIDASFLEEVKELFIKMNDLLTKSISRL